MGFAGKILSFKVSTKCPSNIVEQAAGIWGLKLKNEVIAEYVNISRP